MPDLLLFFKVISMSSIYPLSIPMIYYLFVCGGGAHVTEDNL